MKKIFFILPIALTSGYTNAQTGNRDGSITKIKMIKKIQPE